MPLIRTSPEQQGVDSSAVLQFVEALDNQIHELHSVMLLRHGSVITEGWWSPYASPIPHMVFSLSKSFTSTAVGLAVAEGYFSIDDLVLSFFPDESSANGNDFLAAMSVRHLLTMSSGHAVDPWSNMDKRPDNNTLKGFFEAPITYAPGTHFVYNTGATYILTAIVEKTTGMSLIEYLEPRLFEPLGIANATWDKSPQGITLGGIGLKIKTEDVARFGQLYLQKGIWKGKQLLSETWIAGATTAQIANGDDSQSDWSQGYGYQFWRCRYGAYRGDGVFGQYCVVMPEQDAVLVMTGGIDVFDMQQPLNLFWEILLPAMHNEVLPENPVSLERLTQKLARLKLEPVAGAVTSPLASQISGRTYRVDANEIQLETITLKFSADGWIAKVKTPVGEESIPCGYGKWQLGETAFFKNTWVSGRTPIVASGAWIAEDSFQMVVRLYETPFFHTLTFHFIDDELMLEIQVNTSLESTKPLLLTASS